MIARVAVNLPLDKIFSYLVPPEYRENIKVGQVVVVPFRNRNIYGYVVALENKKNYFNLKTIIELKEEYLTQDLIELSHWLASYYYASLGECMSAMLPSAVKKQTRARKRYIIEREKGYRAPRKLSTAQEKALNEIIPYIEASEHKVFLLYGVTGSGKTEVYIRAIERALSKGRGAIILVPEIALTPQTIARFYHRFGDIISVMHSKLTEGQRYQEWQKLKKGVSKIAIGARSAIFAPIAELGLIVVDEEHEISYKQKETPRYHAREVAIKRAQLLNIPIILGSATPSLETFYHAKNGKYVLLQLPQRIKKRKLPQIEIVDMRLEKRYPPIKSIFSQRLILELKKTIDDGNQAILFLNRRGFATYIYCSRCGYVMRCPRCEIALTYHSMRKILLCHYCNYTTEATLICPGCNGNYLSYRGIGTQKVESQLQRILPAAKSERLDSDAITIRGKLEQIIKNFRARKIDILVGTQLVAKGHDFPQVNLVGVILADMSLNIIDFRADERTFSLLTQVAGRAGRGKERGKVIIQTYNPEHPAIRYAIKHDYLSFYKEEIKKRKELNFPPFSHFIRLTFKAKKEENAIKASNFLKEEMAKLGGKRLKLLGPAPHPVVKLKRYYRWQLVIVGKEIEYILRLLYNIIGYKRRLRGCEVIVDVDPYED